MEGDWENCGPSTSAALTTDQGYTAMLQASPGRLSSPFPPGPSAYRSPQQHMKLSDRFIPSRTAAARLDYSILDRELVTAEVSRNASEREVCACHQLGSKLLLCVRPSMLAVTLNIALTRQVSVTPVSAFVYGDWAAGFISSLLFPQRPLHPWTL